MNYSQSMNPNSPRVDPSDGEPSHKDDPVREIMRLRIYIASGSPNSVNATANLKMICQNHLNVQILVEVVDIWKEPSRALADGILVTPTLRRLMPQPEVNIFGDLSDTPAVTTALGLDKYLEK